MSKFTLKELAKKVKKSGKSQNKKGMINLEILKAKLPGGQLER
jgi:hypothetical protein